MESVTLKRKEYKIEKEITDGVFLVSYKDKKFILKQFKDSFDYNEEINAHKKLKKYGINIPKIVKEFKKNYVVLEEFIDDRTMFDELIERDISDDIFKELFNIYRFCRFSHIALDYHPKNFAMKKGRLYYLSNFFTKETEENKLENDGIYLWIYSPRTVAEIRNAGLTVDKKRTMTQPEANKKIVLISIMHW